MKLRSLSLIALGCAMLAVALRVQLDKAEAAPKAERSTALSRTPPQYRRAVEFTFLTVPEWYLVWSPDEYADFLTERPPSEFPYLGHLRQFWQGYGVVYDATKEAFPFNTDYHVMIVVIGTSTTAEYGVKGAYENIVGRVTEASRLHGMTEEDRLAAKVAREYVDFIVVEPWYKFDFLTPLQRLWAETGLWGPDPIRKWERKYFLTTEYAAKTVYGWLIKKASESVYEEERPVSAVLLDRFPVDARQELPEVKVLKEHPDGSVLALVPRYQAFTKHARVLSHSGANFLEITGNREVILLSALVPLGFDDSGLQLLMKQPILTRPGLQRILFSVPVPELASLLRELDKPPFRLEHVYDY
jgi:hypothetical protein